MKFEQTPSSLGRRARRFLLSCANVFAIAAGAWIAWPASSFAADPDALWKIVHGLCVPDARALGAPAPCSAVDLAGGYAILKDISGASQYLLMPTEKVAGIESPAILANSAPNYWQDAWKARSFVEHSLGKTLPREDVGLAINSFYGRSQNQLHIHIDCVRADVKSALRANQKRIGRHWSVVRLPLGNHRYRAMRIEQAELGAINPFKLLADGDPTAKTDMGRETLVVIGETFSDGRQGFVLLSDRATVLPPDRASGEELLDHACAVAKEAKPL